MKKTLHDYAGPQGLPKVYISGPMTGMKNHNRAAFVEAERYLTGLGFTVFNPSNNPNSEKFTWEMYMKWDLKNMLDCDLIFMLDGWENSRGAKLEKFLADEMKIPELKKSLIELVSEVDFGKNY